MGSFRKKEKSLTSEERMRILANFLIDKIIEDYKLGYLSGKQPKYKIKDNIKIYGSSRN